jgi:CHAT domain-containing protein/Tfp pilus assembly protein PilF
MNRLQRHCVVVAASLVLACWFSSPSMAQSRNAPKLEKQFLALYQSETALYQAGKCAEAIPLVQQMLAIGEKAFGPQHPNVAAALNELALVYQCQARYAEAEQLLKRSLAIYEKANGPDHPNVSPPLNNLASVYAALGRYGDAEPLYKRALAIEEKAHGPNDFAVAQSLNNLATLYSQEGHFSVAEPLYKRALAITEKAFKADNRNIGDVMSSLAVLYMYQGRYDEAEVLQKRALTILQNALGTDHPDVAEKLSMLGLLYDIQARYADAEAPLRQAVTIREKTLGLEHPDVAKSLANLGLAYYGRHRYADAEPIYKRALAIAEKSLGHENTDVADDLDDLAILYQKQSRYADAEPLYKEALAIRQKVFGPDNPAHGVEQVLNNLASLYADQQRYADALPFVRRTMRDQSVHDWTSLPVLLGAQAKKLITPGEALDDSLNVAQQALESSTGNALNSLAARFSAGTDRLAKLVRRDQDLASEAENLDQAITAAIVKQPSADKTAVEQRIRDRIAAVAKERDEIKDVLTHEFPDYAALARPEPLTAKDIQLLLAEDEALVIVDLGSEQVGGKSYVWAITRSAADWKELPVSAEDVSESVSALRGQLDFYNLKPFNVQASFELYQKLLAPFEDLLRGKPRLSLVLDGALTGLPPQLLVVRDPAGKALKDVDWLVRTHAITVLPSVASLKVLRGKSATTNAEKPLIGFADPVFDRDPKRLAQNARVAANVTASRGIRGTVADIAELRTALPPLPDTANELREVAASVHGDPADIILGADATESRVKQEKLDQYRIVYFATHGLLAGEVADFAKLNAEPALVLSLPDKPTDFDDGLLTASEVAQLKLNADWVVLSACNTASGEKPGAQALSGLARAFFYAGARSLIVSNWEVETKSAVQLMVGTFAALAANPKLSHGEALQKSILAMIRNAEHPEWADPKFWAPFVVVGEPAKPAK